MMLNDDIPIANKEINNHFYNCTASTENNLQFCVTKDPHSLKGWGEAIVIRPLCLSDCLLYNSKTVHRIRVMVSHKVGSIRGSVILNGD